MNYFSKRVLDSTNGEYEVLGNYVNNKTKISIIHHKCGNIYDVKPTEFSRGNRCPKCGKEARKRSLNNIKDTLYDKFKNEYQILTKKINNVNDNIEVLHVACNTSFITKSSSLVRNICPCPSCRVKIKNNSLTTIEEVLNKFNKISNNEYKLLTSNIQKSTDLVNIKCLKCGYIFSIKLNIFLKYNSRCPSCQIGNKRANTDSFRYFLTTKYGDTILLLEEYINNETKIKFKCNICDNIWSTTPRDMKTNKVGCPICARKKLADIQQKNTDIFKKEILDKYGDKYTVLGEYLGTHDSIKIQCNECGHIWFPMPTNIIHKDITSCPRCNLGKTISNKENSIGIFILKNNIDYIHNNRSILDGKELDIYLPDKKIAIEFDGTYWHSVKYIKDPNYHLNKTIECEKQGIHLIHIFEDEWNFKEDIVKSKLLHILGEDHNPSVYARKCYIEEIGSKSKNEFLLENHIQGADKSNIKLGLWYPNHDGDELVAVMTFCNLRKSLGQVSKKGHYELSRFATAHEYRVIGAFGKLWKYFCNNYEFEEITTYADRRWTYSKNNVYETCGFQLDHISKPNYWYVKSEKRYHRYKFRKSELRKLFPSLYSDDKTEKEIMEEAGYSKIYDCGNLVFKYKNKS